MMPLICTCERVYCVIKSLSGILERKRKNTGNAVESKRGN